MAWVTPPTFVSGNALTAAQLNTLSGDLNETAAGKASVAGQFFVSSGVNTLVARSPQYAIVDTAETTTLIDPTYGDLTTVGPAVTVTVAGSAIVFWSARMWNSAGSGGAEMSWALSGATTLAAPNGHTLQIRATTGAGAEASQASKVNWQVNINPGSNTFTTKYTTPTGGTATFQFRDILVLPF